ncbi:hypothetical protein P3L10_016771 [Capsicum annuum]
MWLKKVFCIFATLFYRFLLVGGCYEGERVALMSFKSLLTDPSNRLASWKGENCCSWKGIECLSSGRVVVVNLRNPHPDEVMISINNQVISNSNNAFDFALKGAISPLLFSLDHIQHLDLSFNNFVFSKLPVEISNLTKLTYLNLSNAMFQDSIDMQFSNLTSLRSLDLSCANLVPDFSYSKSKIYQRILIGQLLNLYILTSTIPDMFSNLTTLSVLDISDNDLDGHIPYLPQLEQLYDSNNPAMTIDLVSMFSATWSKLKFLDKSFTHVGGTLPPSLSNSTSLTFFQADGCSIQGSIPSSVTKLKKLRMLTLNDNNITGQLPVSMSSLISLRYLSLIQSGLRGMVPWCILQLPKLLYLSVNKNNLNGNVPLSLLQKSRLDLTSIVILILVNKSLSGAILYWLFNLPALSALDLPMNNFEGVIPPTIQMKSSLFPSIVNLARKKLQGHIPTQLENVNVIDLSLNNFVGSIPAQMGEIPAIRSIALSGNKIHGPIPESFCQSINVLQVLDLSNNSFSGIIPRSLGSCKSLIYLSLGQNKLTGSVPEELERVTSLRCLDLNGNEFEGSFPTVIEKFQELEILNLAGNRFKGRIPKFIGDLNHLRILVLASSSFNESIPEGVMKLENLQLLVCPGTNCPFTGALLEIVTKGQMRFLVSVYSYNTGFDVSSNALTGKIPEKIGEIPVTLATLDFLAYLNLSYNNLSGRIPTNPHFDTLHPDGTAYIGNRYLCGSPDGMNCSKIGPSTTETMENRYNQENVLFIGVIFSGFVTGISGVFLLLYLIDDNWRNRYWRVVDKIVLKIVNCKP